MNFFLLDVMNDIGFDISQATREPLNRQSIDHYDKVISMALPSHSPDWLLQLPTYEYWDVKDPRGQDYETTARVRDEVLARVKRLIAADRGYDSNASLHVAALIATRKKGDAPLEFLNVLARNKTKYGFPGGKLEATESPEQAVVRETEEELGVIPTNIVYQNTYEALTPEGRGIKMAVFTGSVTEDIAPTNEIAELHWLTYDQMVSNPDLLTPMTIEHILPLIKAL